MKFKAESWAHVISFLSKIIHIMKGYEIRNYQKLTTSTSKSETVICRFRFYKSRWTMMTKKTSESILIASSHHAGTIEKKVCYICTI